MTTGLSAKEQALVGIGAAVASGCQPCTAKYIETARTAGACERSIRLAVETAIEERQRATKAMAEWAQQVQGHIPPLDASFRVEKQKNTALIAAVAAHTVHSTATLDANLSNVLKQGWTPTQVEQALDVARAVAKAATKNAETAAGAGYSASQEADGSCCNMPSAESAPSSCDCGCSGT